MDSVVDTVVGSMEKTSQKHEKKIVIELWADRIIHFIVIYVFGFLAITTIIFTVIGKSMSSSVKRWFWLKSKNHLNTIRLFFF